MIEGKGERGGEGGLERDCLLGLDIDYVNSCWLQ